jgi:hypothetical protein
MRVSIGLPPLYDHIRVHPWPATQSQLGALRYGRSICRAPDDRARVGGHSRLPFGKVWPQRPRRAAIHVYRFDLPVIRCYAANDAAPFPDRTGNVTTTIGG